MRAIAWKMNLPHFYGLRKNVAGSFPECPSSRPMPFTTLTQNSKRPARSLFHATEEHCGHPRGRRGPVVSVSTRPTVERDGIR
jgi:hypothetical protein